MNEEQLIQRCRNNSRQAQRELFDATYKPLFRLAVRYLGNHHDAEDVLAETYIRIFRGIGRFEWQGCGSLRRWMNTLVINESLRYLRRRKLLIFDEEMLLHEPGFDIMSDQHLPDHEHIKSIIETMPAGYRTVFNLFAIEGYSHREIAVMLSISENTSRTQLFKARQFVIQRITNQVHYETV